LAIRFISFGVGTIMTDLAAPNMIQELPWEPAIQAFKDSIGFDDFSTFRAHLEENLPYNSAETRERYTQTIIKYFFPNGSLGELPERVWHAYMDDQLLEESMRYQFLTQEPTVAQFLVVQLNPMSPGSVLERASLEEFIKKVDPKGRKKMVERLGYALRRMGLVVRERRQDIVTQLQPTKTSLLILVHHLYAPTPRIVTLRDILEDPFWQYLGFRQEAIVRRILHEANANGLIAAYATIDQLEQITTRYTLDEWYEKRLRL
jgi:hypothetical protein